MTETPLTPEKFAAAQAEEWGTYVAKEVIYYNGARAFNPGDAVPIGHVNQYGYEEQGLVEKRKASETKAAVKAATADPNITTNP